MPEDTLIFPAPGDDLTKPRHPDPVTKRFRAGAAKLGFHRLRFHDLRGAHETILLDAGMPVHTVAARGGHDPAILLRIYAKRTKKSDRGRRYRARQDGALRLWGAIVSKPPNRCGNVLRRATTST
jgi:integrase